MLCGVKGDRSADVDCSAADWIVSLSCSVALLVILGQGGIYGLPAQSLAGSGIYQWD